MPDTSLDILAEEFGAVAGRIEREIRQQAATLTADLRAKIAELELSVVRLERDAQDRISKALAEVRHGRDGIDGQPGERGLQGERGERGFQGERGEMGPQGERGLDGRDGEPGLPGEQGERGFRGEQGEAGPQGERGLDGRDGERGPQGERGPEGAPGKLTIVKAYEPGAVAYEGDLVHLDGSTYQARKDTAQQPPHGDWAPIATKGADARDWVMRGLYEPEGEYTRGDVVAREGGSWIAVKDDPGPLPGDGWRQLVQKGKRGDRGENGAKGERGERGPAGASIIGGTFDAETAKLTLVRDDGESIDIDLYDLALALRG